ncbi:MAG: adenylate cyclase [Chthoniobacter sp.]|jgi:adenylate cyclase|nr:adenylate cyclase [Chthoniobacter sp.]
MRRFALPSKPTLAGVALIVVVGLVCTAFRLGNPLARLSYDLTFRFAHPYAPPEVVLVTIDDQSRKELGIPAGRAVSRARQAKLLERLTRDGARIVFYDLIFDLPSDDPAEDEAFATAMKRHGSVVLSGLHDKVARNSVTEEIIAEPTPLLRGAARGWGLAGPLLLDPDNTVRRVGLPLTEEPLAHWLVAELANAPATKAHADREAVRWLNYYGPAGTIPWCSFHEALDERMRSPEFFRGKIVCIGGKPSPVGRKFGEDEFGYPHARWGAPYIIGLEIHATALLNLLRGEWLQRLSLPMELALVALLGLGAGAAAYSLSPMRAIFVLAAAALVVAVGAMALQIHGHLWWNWLVPVAVQFPLAAFWSTVTRYAGEARRRAQLRQAFSLYLSPHMADRITEEKMDLKPGGQLIEATVLFTDCKGFTAMSEELKDAKVISDTLIAYFTQTSRHVLENDGTIMKYIGDAVFACWNAPLLDPDHAAKAARAGWAMSEASKQVVLGRVLTTRVGICTGEVVAGNLGSPYRFDYTCIGEAVNFASRLEALNKLLGTGVILADTTRRAVGERFICRALGSFIVAGKTTPVAIHELIAPGESKPADLAWLQTWNDAMRALREGDFMALQKLLREVVWQRGGTDGPSEYYLKRVAQLEKDGQLADWTGVVKLTEK